MKLLTSLPKKSLREDVEVEKLNKNIKNFMEGYK